MPHIDQDNVFYLAWISAVTWFSSFSDYALKSLFCYPKTYLSSVVQKCTREILIIDLTYYEEEKLY